MRLVYTLIILLAALVLYAVALFNSLVRLRNQKDNAWSQVDVQLKRRHDLIPNLVETVKGYAAHERELFESVTRLRGEAGRASGLADIATAEGQLARALGRIMAVAEAYPALKADANFRALQEELTSTENKIAFARQFYNDSVMHLNTRIQSFPANLVAGALGFAAAAFFELDEVSARAVPKASFE